MKCHGHHCLKSLVERLILPSMSSFGHPQHNVRAQSACFEEEAVAACKAPAAKVCPPGQAMPALPQVSCQAFGLFWPSNQACAVSIIRSATSEQHESACFVTCVQLRRTQWLFPKGRLQRPDQGADQCQRCPKSLVERLICFQACAVSAIRSATSEQHESAYFVTCVQLRRTQWLFPKGRLQRPDQGADQRQRCPKSLVERLICFQACAVSAIRSATSEQHESACFVTCVQLRRTQLLFPRGRLQRPDRGAKQRPKPRTSRTREEEAKLHRTPRARHLCLKLCCVVSRRCVCVWGIHSVPLVPVASDRFSRCTYLAT